LQALINLASDEKNLIFIISEYDSSVLDEAFSGIKNIGLACENGFLCKIVGQTDHSSSDGWIELDGNESEVD